MGTGIHIATLQASCTELLITKNHRVPASLRFVCARCCMMKPTSPVQMC